MNQEQWKNIMDGFQGKGGFVISDHEMRLWEDMYFNKRVDAVVRSFKEFLIERKDDKTPKAGQLYPRYKNACIAIDAHARAQQGPPDNKQAVPFEKLKESGSTVGYDLGPIINTRAHNLCKRWQGFMGYDNHGRVSSESSFTRFAGMIDEAIKTQIGDPKTVVEDAAALLAHKYKGARVPDHVQKRVA